MSAPESQTSADEALSSLMGAVISSPEYARLVSAPRDWKAVQAAIDDYLEGYELRLDEGCHTPTEFERFLLVDAVAGLMHDDEFIDALYSVVTAARPAPAAGDARDAARYRWLRHEGREEKHQDDGAIYVRQVQLTSGVITGSAVLVEEDLDAAIDAALAAQVPHKGDAA